MPENNQMMSLEGQLVGMPLAGPESFSQQQLEYLKRAIGIDETVLFENQNGVQLKNGITLSESRLNFEYLRITLSLQDDTASPRGYIDIPMSGINAGSSFQFQLNLPFNNNDGATFALNWKILVSATDTTLTSTNAMYWGKTNFDGSSSGAGSWTQGANSNWPYVYKIVGVHRIAGGNQ